MSQTLTTFINALVSWLQCNPKIVKHSLCNSGERFDTIVLELNKIHLRLSGLSRQIYSKSRTCPIVWNRYSYQDFTLKWTSVLSFIFQTRSSCCFMRVWCEWGYSSFCEKIMYEISNKAQQNKNNTVNKPPTKA